MKSFCLFDFPRRLRFVGTFVFTSFISLGGFFRHWQRGAEEESTNEILMISEQSQIKNRKSNERIIY